MKIFTDVVKLQTQNTDCKDKMAQTLSHETKEKAVQHDSGELM